MVYNNGYSFQVSKSLTRCILRCHTSQLDMNPLAQNAIYTSHSQFENGFPSSVDVDIGAGDRGNSFPNFPNEGLHEVNKSPSGN